MRRSSPPSVASPLQPGPTMRLSSICFLVVLLAFIPGVASAHCDTMDGPVVKAGQRALDSGEVDQALIWVQPAAEPELRATFQQALAVRKLGADARSLADRYFLETLVRLHRAGEGEPYTGLKPAGIDPGPAIAAADAAIASGTVRSLSRLITETTTRGLEHRFHRVVAARRYKLHDVAAGRAYVAAYVAFVHYAEQAYEAAQSREQGHLH